VPEGKEENFQVAAAKERMKWYRDVAVERLQSYEALKYAPLLMEAVYLHGFYSEIGMMYTLPHDSFRVLMLEGLRE
jgi:hypothetical protein